VRAYIKPIARVITAVGFVAIGVLHFVDPKPFLQIMPAYLPWHLELVYLSGVFEVLGGVGLLVPRTRRFSAWGLIALLLVVYLANINMLVNDIYLDGMPRERWLLWARMPMQFVFIALVAWTGGLWPRARTRG
jgi:uncharacterized membrane protein